MKKTLLLSVLTGALLSAVSAESFSGVFVAGKGSVFVFNKAILPDLSKQSLTSKDTKEYGGFGFNGVGGGAEFGYSFRFANNFVMGISAGGGYKHYAINEALEDGAISRGFEAKNLGLDFVTSGLAPEVRLRLGMVFGRFNVYLNPGFELAMEHPELTVKYGEWESRGATNSVLEKKSQKIKYAADKAPDWKERLSFVMGLNVEYAVTQTMFLGGNVGYRHSLADVKTVKDITSVALPSTVQDIAYKNPIGLELGITVGASF